MNDNNLDALLTFVNSISLVVFIKDTKNNVVGMNNYAKSILDRYEKDNIFNGGDHVFGDASSMIYEDDLHIIKTKKPIMGKIEKINPFGGEEKIVMVDKVPHLNSVGEVDFIFIISQDLTEETRIRLELESITPLASIGQNTAELVHNLKNSLTLAISATESISKEAPASNKLNTLNVAHGRILASVEEVLLFKPDQDSKSKEERLETNIYEEIQNSILEIEQSGKDPSIREYLSFTCEQNYMTPMKPLHFRQIITNLINNSIDAIKDVAKKRIKINAQVLNNVIMIDVVDNGEGIVAENIGKIFEPKFSTKEYSSALESGNGLGLSFVKRTIESYGGKIRVSSFPQEGELPQK